VLCSKVCRFLKGALSILSVLSVPAQAMEAMAPQSPTRAPTGVMGAAAGMPGKWMFGYRLMHSEWNGNRAGRKKISPQHAQARFGYNLMPTDMNVNMHMFSLMHTPRKGVSVSLMAPYISKWMAMQRLTPGGAVADKFSMTSQGLGDIRTNAIIDLYSSGNHHAVLNFGLSAPSGSIDRHSATPISPSMKLPYIMQIGSGTWDLLPGLTYRGHYGAVGWGGQYRATLRLGKNSNDYARGDRHHLNLWAAYAWRPWFNISARVLGAHWGDIEGSDPGLNPNMVQTADPQNYGGERVEGALGLNVKVPAGWLKGQRFGFEFMAPLYQNLNGLQMDLDLRVLGGWRTMF